MCQMMLQEEKDRDRAEVRAILHGLDTSKWTESDWYFYASGI